MEINKELAVSALRNGTVIDGIPANALFEVARILRIEEMDTPVTIGNNLPSSKMGKKGIIKVADRTFPEETLNRIALAAPGARVNIIKDYQVAEKFNVKLPPMIIGLVTCPNPKCITNNEPMASRFKVISDDPVCIECCYCGRKINH